MLTKGVLYTAEERKKRGIPQGYVFICSNWTQEECLDRRLFAMPKSKWSRVSQVKEGDILLLLNYQTNHLHGIFEAASDAGLDIEPHAFGGRFPAQVRVKRKMKCRWVDKSMLLSLIRRKQIRVSRNGVLIFPDRLDSKLIEELCRIFLEIPHAFRTRKETTEFKAKNGHFTGSYGERHVDDWLHEHLPYKHLYNFPKELSGQVVRCDWHVPDLGLYIEYWEEPSPTYTDAVNMKHKLYADHSLKVVNLYENDLPTLDRIIPTRIRALVPKCRFRKLGRQTRKHAVKRRAS